MKLWKKSSTKETAVKPDQAQREREGKPAPTSEKTTSTDKASGSRRSSTVTDGEAG